MRIYNLSCLLVLHHYGHVHACTSPPLLSTVCFVTHVDAKTHAVLSELLVLLMLNGRIVVQALFVATRPLPGVTCAASCV